MGTMDRKKLCIGIDLGTTNTSVAVSRLTTNNVVIVDDQEIFQPDSTRKQDTIPSILYVQDGRERVGNKALDLKKHFIQSPDSQPPYIENSKRDIGTGIRYRIGDREYTPVDVAERILSVIMKEPKIKKNVETADVCITVPANFGPDQVNHTLEAAHRAGFRNAVLYAEPKAAILSFLHEEQEKRENRLLDLSSPKRILVVDVGGGTCDICILDVSRNGSSGYGFRQLAINRDDLGGVDFDRKVAICLAQKLNLRNPTQTEFAQLIDIGQTFKESMSSKIEALVYDEYDGEEEQLMLCPDWREQIAQAEPITLTRELSGQPVDFELTVEEICDAIQPLIRSEGKTSSNQSERERNKNLQDLIDDTLTQYDIPAESVDTIFLAGGMSRCFALRAILHELYGKPIVSPEKPFLAVSRGASLLNKYELSEIDSDNKMPRSILIETDNGHLRTLVGAGESIPVERTVDQTFHTTSRNAVMIRLFEGLDEYDNQLRKLNNVYTIQFDQVFSTGRPFRIHYAIDSSKQICFTIQFTDDQSEYTIKARMKEDEEGCGDGC